MTVVFIDANVPLYASGGRHPLREPCRRLLRAIGKRELEAWTNAEVLQEVLHRCIRGEQTGRRGALAAFDDFIQLVRSTLLPIGVEDLLWARALAGELPVLPAADLVHVATMERHGLTRIVTADRHFDEVPGIERIDPATFS